MRRTTRLTLAALVVLGLGMTPAARAVHFYRGPGGGCTPADGALGDAASPGATVLMLHNTFNDTETRGPVTFIEAGESVTWTWNSEHCHSVWEGVPPTGGTVFYSGFHYPSDEPTTPAAVPGLFHYPVPTLSPTLSFTHTFDAPGVYQYFCEHHAAIGMVGVVVVS